MSGQISDAIVDLCGGVDDGICVVSEASQCASVLLRLELLCMGSSLCVVKLEGIVGASKEEKLARGIKV